MKLSCGLKKRPLGRFFFRIFYLTAFAQILLFSFGTALHALRARDHVDNNLAAVFTAIGARRMRDAQLAAFASRKTHPRDSVVRPALSRLRPISAHSDYHRATEYSNSAKYQAATSESSSTSTGSSMSSPAKIRAQYDLR
jgi:hypothetical protein